MSERWELLVRRDDLAVTEVREAEVPELSDGEVELAVERLALTMNNVTYARWGEVPPLNFWNAFPATDPAWGRLPVWGFLRVSRSRHADFAPGDRYFGYVPSSSHHVVTPGPASRGFVDTTPDRYFAHPWYQTFQPAPEADGRDDRRTLLRPIYPASFLVADFVAGKGGDDGLTVLVTSASSKVAIGIAHRLRGNENVRVVGLTSESNAEFVASLELYDSVAAYDDLAPVSADGPVAVVDLAGDNEVLTAVHRTFQSDLVHVALLGWTHGAQPPPPLTDPTPELFFTPAVEGVLIEAEGEDAFFARYEAAESAFIDVTESWLKIAEASGPEAVATVYRSLLDGTHPVDGFTIITP
ncbi:DUF2855 family protein [Actinophytocola oryzae]|uniref:NADPH-dependent curcumin reductase CurA n=1 Tax=Actinophytocola oryzae TaxID=502181 RepID=A0A4R7UZT9_9PSEU|nr:DUF2855 family protein [Actinophytocola oryzae]TDV41065.1 NADPH-dependent curcumin reductase CurA [Actinophytocola oryzae]